jgi:hypothetical protein
VGKRERERDGDDVTWIRVGDDHWLLGVVQGVVAVPGHQAALGFTNGLYYRSVLKIDQWLCSN